MSAALKRGHEPQRILGDLLEAEISEKKARSIKHQMTIAKLPLAKELEEFDFGAAEVDEALVRSLASGDALDRQRNAVLVGGTGTGKTHLAVGLAEKTRPAQKGDPRRLNRLATETHKNWGILLRHFWGVLLRH